MTDADGFFGGRGGQLPNLMVEDPTQDPDKLAPESSISPDEEAEEILRQEALRQAAHNLGGQSSSRRIAIDDAVGSAEGSSSAVMEVVGLEPSPPYTFADYVGHREQLQQQEIIQQHQNMVQNPIMMGLPGAGMPMFATVSPPITTTTAPPGIAPHVTIQMPPQSMSDSQPIDSAVPMLCNCSAASEGRHTRRCRRQRRRNRRRRASISSDLYSDSESEDSDKEIDTRRLRKKKSRKAKCKRLVISSLCLIGVSFLLLQIYRTFAPSAGREWPWPQYGRGPIENTFECLRAPYSYHGESSFTFPLLPTQSENASITASPLDSFYLKQRPMNKNYPWQESPGYHYGGKVSVVGYTPAAGQPPAVKVEFDIHTSKPEMRNMIRLVKGDDGQGVVLYTDYSDRQLIKPLGCATIQATISVPKGKGPGLSFIPTILSNLDISVETLCISIDSSSLELSVSDKTSLNSLCGGITFSNASIPIERPQLPGDMSRFTAPPTEPVIDAFRSVKSGFSTRKFFVKTQTGAVLAIPLVVFDEVDVETSTGNIRLAFDSATPEMLSPGISALPPAKINVRSVSGNIYLESPPPCANITDIRRTITKAQSTSGSVSGSILLPPSSELTIESFSGDIFPLEVLVLPSTSTRFTTDTKTGHTNIRILETGGDLVETTPDSKPLTVKGWHTSFSGAIEVSYPQRWEGNILARTLNGNITMRGEGVTIVSENGGAAEDPSLFRRTGSETSTGPTKKGDLTEEQERELAAEEEDEDNDNLSAPFSLPPISSGLWTTIRGQKASSPTSPTPPSSDARIVSVSGNIEFLVGLRRKSWVERGRERIERFKGWLRLAAEKAGCSRFRDALIRGVSLGGQRRPPSPIMPPGGHEQQNSDAQAKKLDLAKFIPS